MTQPYSFDGHSYAGDRVALQSGSDNIGSYHQRVYAELTRYQQSAKPFRCYVNPTAPAESILYRELRWGLVGLHLAFARHTCDLIEILPVRTELQKATLAEPLRFENGHLLPPTKPGAGLVWRDDLPKQFPFIPGSGERSGEG